MAKGPKKGGRFLGGSGVGASAPDVAGLDVGAVESAVAEAHGGDSSSSLLDAAVAAQDDYDYDRAHQLLRLAVRVSGGGRREVEALGRFLVDSYAQYDEAVRLLSSPAVDIGHGTALRRLLADALVMSDHGAEAREHYEALVTHREIGDDASVWDRLGTLREAAGDDAGAAEALRTALRLAPGNARAEQRLRAVEERLSGAAAAQVEQARAAIAAGDKAQAKALLGAVLDGPGDHRAAATLLRELDAAERQSTAEEREAAARDAEARGELGTAIDAWRAVLDLVPEHADARQALPRLERALGEEQFAERLARGADAFERGQLDEAIRAFYRAYVVRPEGATPPAELVGRPLCELTWRYLEAEGARHLDRALPALVALYRAESACESGVEEDAAAHMREASTTLSGFAPLEDLRERLAGLSRGRTLARAQDALAEAQGKEEAGDLEAARDGYRRALTLAGGAVGDAEERLARVEEQIRAQGDRRRFRERLASLEAAERWFDLRRAVLSARPGEADESELERLKTLAGQHIADRYTPSLIAPPWLPDEDRGSVLDSRPVQLPDVDRKELRVLLTPDGSRLLVLSGPLLVVVDTDTLTVPLVAEMPEAINFGSRCEVVLAGNHPEGGLQLALVNECDAELLLLRADQDGVRLDDRFDLSSIVPSNREKTARFYALHASSQRLVQLRTQRDPAGPSLVRNLSLSDGRLVHEEEHGFGLWGLLPFRGEDRYVVSRLPNYALRLRPGYFNFAVMDHRGRFVERFNLRLEDMPEPIETLRSFTHSPSLGRYFVTYDYFDALGQITRRNPALMVLRSSHEIFYQSASPEKLLQGRRLPAGRVKLVEPPNEESLLVLPHTDAEGVAGVSVLGAEDLKPRFEADLDPGEVLHSLHESRGASRLHAVTFPHGDGAWRIRRLDLAAQRWCG